MSSIVRRWSRCELPDDQVEFVAALHSDCAFRASTSVTGQRSPTRPLPRSLTIHDSHIALLSRMANVPKTNRTQRSSAVRRMPELLSCSPDAYGEWVLPETCRFVRPLMLGSTLSTL